MLLRTLYSVQLVKIGTFINQEWDDARFPSEVTTYLTRVQYVTLFTKSITA